MAIRTIKIFTCDLCGSEMSENEDLIYIKVDQKSEGWSTITGYLKYTQPYGRVNGLVCKTCKKEWLTKYVESL